MKTLNLTQGSAEWHAHRAQHWNASDAPAMLGVSPYKTRAELLHERATGITAQIDDAKARMFEAGHAFEALARPLAERIIGEDLYPCTGVNGRLSASFDGLDICGELAWEHKTLNAELRECMRIATLQDSIYTEGDELPEHYRVQMEQQLTVSGATRVLFTASEWNADGSLIEARHCWYESDPALRARIMAGWAQFEQDLQNYQHQEAPPKPVGRAPDSLPALLIQCTGMVTASNLPAFRDAAIARFKGINADLRTDQDFADAESSIKFCDDMESRLDAAKRHALSQTASIDELFRAIDAISAEARAKRLELQRLVAARKEAVKSEIVDAGMASLVAHVDAINATMGEHALPDPRHYERAQIGASIKGLRTVASIRAAADAAVASLKITASQQAERIRACIAVLAEHPEHATLWPDRVQLCASKAPDDLRNLVAARIAEHKRLEEAKEAARIAAEAATQAAAIAPAAQVAPTTPVTAAVASISPAPAGPRLNLGDINRLLAPIQITADGLRQLGVESIGKERAAHLYAEADLPRICESLQQVLTQVVSKRARAAA